MGVRMCFIRELFVTKNGQNFPTQLRGRNRRDLLALLAAPAVFGKSLKVQASTNQQILRFGTTPVFLDDQIGLLAGWRLYLQRILNQEVRFIQRGSYREILDLLLKEQLDIAWLCGFPYVMHADSLQLIATPVYRGKPHYRSLLIVNRNNLNVTDIADLRDRVFAFSDPLSNSGYLVPLSKLALLNTNPENFFRRTFFTFSHRKVVEAVQTGLADAGCVDGYVWDTLVLKNPALKDSVRVAWESPSFGFPPIVARARLSPDIQIRIRAAFIGMNSDASGKTLLNALNIDSFDTSSSAQFDSIKSLARRLNRLSS
jgi:phosphonate transport system substrate-binding protein